MADDRKVYIVADPGSTKLAFTLNALADSTNVTVYVVHPEQLKIFGGVRAQIIGVDEVTKLGKPIVGLKPSAKRKNLIAQLERAILRRDKNAIRDLTRQLERTY